jgi:uncharacterized GH25 family protein/protocatechuate 3,4-dioxygenase beta subunit
VRKSNEGGSRVLVLLGLLVVAAVAAALWFAFGADDAGSGGGEGAPDAPGVAPTGVTDPSAADRGRRLRAKSAGTAVITGFVKRREGSAAAAGQAVQLAREGFEAWTATADAAGAFRFEALPEGGPFEVKVEAAGFATVRIPGIGLGRGETRSVGTLWLDRAVRLPVSVRDWSDRPVAGAEVKAFVAPDYGADFDWSKAWAQMAVEPVAVASATTDAKGSAVFPEMASGRWTLVAKATGMSRAAARDVVLRGGENPPEVVIRLGMGHTLSGRVLDPDGKPVPAAVVLGGRPNDAWDMGSAASRARAVADGEGKWALENLDAGTVALFVARKGGVPGWRASVRVPSVRQFDLILPATGSLEGHVTEKASGKPVPGALVRASQWGWTAHVAEATTDAEGKYRIESFPAGDVHDLRAEKEGLVHVQADNSMMWGMTERRVHAGDTLTADLQMQTGAAVAGRVTSGGNGVAGAKVILRPASPTAGAESPRTAVTDAEGRYRIADARPGKAFAQAVCEGWFQKDFPENWWEIVQDESRGTAFRVEVPESGEVTLDLTLQKGAVVTGTVEGPEGAVAGAHVNAQGAQATSSAEGKFRLEGVVPGESVTVSAAKKGLMAAKVATVAVSEESGASDVVLQLTAIPVVRGRVLGPDGGPVAGSRVTVIPKSDEMQPWYVGYDPTAHLPQWPVREDGSFEAEVALTSGGFQVRATAPGFGTATSETVAIREGTTVYQADVRLAPGETLRGRVMSGGSGVAGAQVMLQRRQENQANQMMMVMNGGMSGEVWAVTDAAGDFEAGPMEAGTWDATVHAQGFVRKSQNEIKVPSGGPVTIVIDAALEIAGKVVFTDDTPVEGVSISVAAGDQNGQMVFIPGGDTENQRATTDRAGRFRLKGVPPGSHRLRVEAPWSSRTNVRPQTTDAVQAGSQDARIVVAPGGIIAGKVMDSDRKPMANVWISVNPTNQTEDNTYRGGMTKQDGTFEIVGLGQGTCVVWAQSQMGGHQPVQKPNVAVGTKDLEIILAAALSIEGVAVKSDGRPAAGVTFQAEPIQEAGDEGNDMQWGQSMSPTQSDGKFKVTGLKPGRYRLQIANWGQPSSLRVGSDEPIAAGSTGVRITLTEGAKISGVVVDEAGSPLAGAQVWASLGNDSHSAVSGKDGRFEIGGLAAGKHTVSANLQGRAPASAQNVAEGTSDVRLVLVKGLSLSGTVLDRDGKPCANTNVHLTLGKDGADGHNWAQTDAQGRFKAEGLKEGTWAVAVMQQNPEKPGEWVETPAGTVAAGATDVELRLPK